VRRGLVRLRFWFLWLGSRLLLGFGFRLMVTTTATAATTAAAAAAAAAAGIVSTTVASVLKISSRFNAFDSTNTGRRRRGSGCADDSKSKENGGDEIHFV